MTRLLIFVFALTGCAPPPVAFTPAVVDMPVAQACPPPPLSKPPDLLAPLAPAMPLAEALRSCLRQTLADQAYATQLEAAQAACR